MGRLVSFLLAVLLVASVADAKTPLRKCRQACKPLVSSVCPPSGKALRRCRTPILRECRRDGIAACALGLPTESPGDGTTTPTTPGSPPTTTSVPPSSVTTTVPGTSPVTTTTTLPGTSPVTTTTTLPPGVPAVAGAWTFEGTIVQAGCTLSYDIESALSVQQDGSALSGTMEGRAATGTVTATGWTFAWSVDNLEAPGATCSRSFVITVPGVTSPVPADATATASCSDGSTCEARWTGSLTRVP